MKSKSLAVIVAALALGSSAAAIAAESTPPASELLIERVRRATTAFQTPASAPADYAPLFGCVSGPDQGAMGIHYVNDKLVHDGEVTPDSPEALIYEARGKQLRLVAVEFIVFAADWDPHHGGPPVLGGQVFEYTGSPNRYRLDPFYSLHVWAWKNNPSGPFADWNPNVSCREFNAEP